MLNNLATAPPDGVPQISTVHLAYVVAVSRHPTWAAAAASLGVTPSALSQGIAELERRVGVPLYAADGRRRVPFEYTATLVEQAERTLADLGGVVRWLRSIGTGEQGRLRVGMIDIAAVHHFREAMRRFRRSATSLSVSFTVAPTGQLLASVERGEVDVAICVDPAGAGRFDATPLLDDELAVYAPAAVVRRGLPKRSQWGPWLLFPPDSRTRRVIDRHLAELGVGRRVEMESHQPEVLCEMVRLGLGWTVLPTAQAEHGPQRLTRAIAEPLCTRTISAVTRSGGPIHPAVAAFVEALRPSPAANVGRARAPSSPRPRRR